jgi:hypothetical protein
VNDTTPGTGAGLRKRLDEIRERKAELKNLRLEEMTDLELIKWVIRMEASTRDLINIVDALLSPRIGDHVRAEMQLPASTKEAKAA